MGGCLLLHSICLPCVEPHPKEDDISNSSWRDGLLAFMEINTSTSQSRNTKFSPQLSRYLSLQGFLFLCSFSSPSELQPPTPFSAKNKLPPCTSNDTRAPTLQDLGACVCVRSPIDPPASHLANVCSAETRLVCNYWGPGLELFQCGSLKVYLTLEMLLVRSSLQPPQGKLSVSTPALVGLKGLGCSRPLSGSSLGETPF